MNFLKYFLLLSGIIVGFVACELEDDDHEFEKVISQHGEDESHEMGENCMRCHYTAGDAEGWFTTAGTIYGEGSGTGGDDDDDDDDDDKGGAAFSDLEVWITTLPEGQGQVLQKIQVDDKGNFYTTDPIDYSQPRYTIVKSSNDEEEMDGPIYHGQCNLCHGVNTEVIEF